MLYLGIDHPAISCHDVNRQVEWYCRHLGMKQIAGNGKTPPSFLIGYEMGAAMIELMPVRDAGPEPAHTPRFQPGLRHLALRVSDFEEAYRRLKNLGVEFLFEPVEAVGGGMTVSFRDPEGNELQIVQRNEKLR
ncbi:MAG TPA: VOC family protein [Tepidisphaeraceae bacterium]|jgi:catechol 2,3-dioxygenase-like lactoylglutathione lyase family enzyme|nr:VOC family protein [Tepidisphaeraceae bacterium]